MNQDRGTGEAAGEDDEGIPLSAVYRQLDDHPAAGLEQLDMEEIMAGVRAAQERMKTDPAYAARIQRLVDETDAQIAAEARHLSLWCRINLSRGLDHHACSGTCDSGHGTGEGYGRPCECPAAHIPPGECGGTPG